MLTRAELPLSIYANISSWRRITDEDKQTSGMFYLYTYTHKHRNVFVVITMLLFVFNYRGLNDKDNLSLILALNYQSLELRRTHLVQYNRIKY